MFAWLHWAYENWFWIALVALAVVTFQFWFKPAVQFFTETKVGGAIAAAAIAGFAGWRLLKSDREANYQRGRADAEREWRVKQSKEVAKRQPKKNEWWLGKR